MKLSQQEVKLFYELLWSLQFYVKQKLKILKKIKTIEEYSICTQEEKMEVRQAIYQNPDLIDTFIQDNPQNFSSDKLEIVSNWKRFVAGDFYIERILKKYTVFISPKKEVYAVNALTNDFSELIHKSRLPFYVKAVLLPFKGRIIYDGVFESYNVYLGSGISYDLKEIYLSAKQNGRIIETLEPELKSEIPIEKIKKVQDFSIELNQISKISKKLTGGSNQPPINSPIFGLIKSSIELGQTAITDPNNSETLWKNLNKVFKSLKKIEKTLSRMEN